MIASPIRAIFVGFSLKIRKPARVVRTIDPPVISGYITDAGNAAAPSCWKKNEQPSKIAAGRPDRDTRSGQQILDDTRAALQKRIERMKQKAAQKEKR